MKAIFFLGLSLFLAGQAHAKTDRPIMTAEERRKVLDKVQEACLNTWCDGEYAFEFKKFKCEKTSCELSFDIVTYKMDKNGRPNLKTGIHFPVSCEQRNVKRFSDLVRSRDDYITDKFFISLNLCIENHVESIGSSNPPEREKGGVPRPPVTSPDPVTVPTPVPNPNPPTASDFNILDYDFPLPAEPPVETPPVEQPAIFLSPNPPIPDSIQ